MMNILTIIVASIRTSSRKKEEERLLHHSGTPCWSKKTSLRAFYFVNIQQHPHQFIYRCLLKCW